MFESTSEEVQGGGVPTAGASLSADVDLGPADLAAALDRPAGSTAVDLEAVPCEPAARVEWLSEELSRLGSRVAAGEFAVPRPGEAGPAEDEPGAGCDGDASPLPRVSPVLEVAPVDGVRVDVIALLERIKSVAAAAQARVTTALAASQEAAALLQLGVTPEPEQTTESTPESTPDEQARRRARATRLARSSVVGQVGLARRISPARAAACVAAARAWTSDLPETLAALDAGDVSEWGAEIVARETSTLTPQLRRRVDEQVGAGLRCWSERQIRAAVVARGYALDPQAAVKRHEKAVSQRRVSTRAAEDGMVWLSALLPVVQGISCQATLAAAASAAKAAGDDRGTGQLMADLLVQAVTGQSAGTPDLPAWVTDPTCWDSGDAATDSDDAAAAGDSASGSDSASDSASGSGSASASASGSASGAAGPASRAPAPPGPPTAGSAASSPAGPASGSAAGPAAGPPLVPVEVQVVISAQALWGDPDDPGYDQPAHVPGYGPIPAWLARHLVRGAPDPDGAGTGSVDGRGGEASRAATFLRRMWACPETGALVALESRRRVFDGGLRRFLIARDQTCRTPYCDAPIRQVDHVLAHADDGPTTAANGQGLCARCNQTKEAPGWHSDVLDDAAASAGDGRRTRTAPATRHAVRVTTPTGHTYRSTAPPVVPMVPPTAPDVTNGRRPRRTQRPGHRTPERTRHRSPDHRLRAFLLRS